MDKWLRIRVVLGLAMAFAACGRTNYRLIALQYRVWQVSAEGQITPFPYEFHLAGYDSNLLGSTVPLPSPDGRWIAFGRFGQDYDIHLLSVSSRQERRITKFGRPPRKGYTYADVLLDAWSPDSRELLLTVAPGETTSEWGDLLIPDAPYGFYIYNLASGTTEPVALPKTFESVAWLPNGRFLGVIPGHRPCEDRLVMFRPGDAQGVPITTPIGSPTHVQVSGDGKWLIGLLIGDMEQWEKAQIVKINLATMSATPLESLSSWSGKPPALSPNGQRISYSLRTRMVNGIPEEILIVDHRQVYSCAGPIDSRWVDDRSIAVACEDQVLVLDVATGKTLGRHNLSPADVYR